MCVVCVCVVCVCECVCVCVCVNVCVCVCVYRSSRRAYGDLAHPRFSVCGRACVPESIDAACGDMADLCHARCLPYTPPPLPPCLHAPWQYRYEALSYYYMRP